MKKTNNKVVPLIVVMVLVVLVIAVWNSFSSKKAVAEDKQVDNISEYKYFLYEGQSSLYKNLFADLKKVLSKEEINEEEYVKIIAQLFIIDFFTLDDKVTNNDIGGTDFVHTKALDNFKLKANDTIYKYVENNVYGDRKQTLPIVSSIRSVSVEQDKFKYDDITDEKAYKVTIKWDYKKDLDYQNEAYLIFVHEDNKLSLVEMSK